MTTGQSVVARVFGSWTTGVSAPDRPASDTAVGGVDTTFLKAAHPWATSALRPIAAAYTVAAHAGRTIPGVAWLFRGHLLFFAAAIVGFVLLTPRFVLLGRFAIEHFVLSAPTLTPDLAALPYMPAIVLPFIAVALVAFFAPTIVRVAALIGISLAAGMAFGYLDGSSVLIFAAFMFAAYWVIRLPISRLAAALMVVALGGVSLGCCVIWLPEAAVTGVFAFQTCLVPMLWYSAYEHKPPKRTLAWHQFVPYLYMRFFGAPAFTYADVFKPAPNTDLAAIRFAGIKALYVAAIASLASSGAAVLLQQFPLRDLHGVPLLLASYVEYVGAYCHIVVPFNLAIGVMRLYGLPVRDNFQYWMLARTPNEHWRRWNLLVREWVITFVLFPIVRTKRRLFVGIMAAVLASGSLHLLPGIINRDIHMLAAVLEIAYWIINGLAIYCFVKAPQVFPALVTRLGLDRRLGWSVVGVVTTSAFYAVLHGVKASSQSWGDVTGFFQRLVG